MNRVFTITTDVITAVVIAIGAIPPLRFRHASSSHLKGLFKGDTHQKTSGVTRSLHGSHINVTSMKDE